MSADPPKPLPANLEAERAVLGAILINNATFHRVASVLTEKHFFREAHRKIYKALFTLCDAGQIADLVTLNDELKRTGHMDDVGGPAYVSALIDGVPASTNINYYAQIVIEKAAKRRLIALGKRVADAAYDDDQPSSKIVHATDAELLAMVDRQRGARAVAVADDLSALYHDLERRIEHKGQIIGLPTGFPTIDALTLGWQKRKMIILGGRTSHGKSIFALTTAVAMARTGARVVYFSLEMERQEQHYRLLAMLSGVPLYQIQIGNLRADQYAAIAQAQEQMHALPIEINDGAVKTMPNIRSECREIQAERGLGAVILDYMQLIEGTEGENRTQQLGAISRSMALLAAELDVPVIGLTQLSRGPKDAQREPELWDIRDSGNIEQDAHVVAFLHPYDPVEAEKDNPEVPTKFLLKKQRGGRRGVASLILQRDYTRFIEGEPPVQGPKVEKPRKAKRYATRALFGSN